MALADGMQVVNARAGELEQEHAFGVIRQLFEPSLHRSSASERDQVLSGAAAPAAGILGLTAHGVGAGAAGFVAMHAIYWLTVNMSQRAPLLLTVDDAHWSDASSLRALDYLARRIGDLEAVLLVSLRPQEPGAFSGLLDELRAPPGATMLTVGPLSESAVAELVRRRIPQAEPELCRAFSETTGGNPLLVEEVLRALCNGGMVPRPEEVAGASVASLGDRVLRRIERVDERAPALARAMAVLGDGGRLATAAALAGIEEEPAGSVAHILRRIELVTAEDPFVFVHPLVRRSLYDEIPTSELHRAHAAAAALLAQQGAAPERVASHLRVLPPSGSPQVAGALLAAAESALGQAAPDEAVAWLERALAEQAPEPPEAELLAQLAAARTLLRDPAAVPTLRRAYEQLEDARRRGEIATSLAHILAMGGEWEASIAVIDQADRELSLDDSAVRADMAAIRANAELYDPGGTADFERHRERYAMIAEGDDWGSRAIAAVLAAEAGFRGRVADARRHMRRAQEDGLLLSERGAGDWAAPQLLSAPIMIDDLEEAAGQIESVGAAARSSGAMLGTFVAIGFEVWRNVRRGDLIAAEADLLGALRFSELAAMPMALANIALFSMDVLLERDAVSHIATEIEQAEWPPRLLETFSGASLLELRGRLRLDRSERGAGIADLRAAGHTLQMLRFGPTVSSWRSALALALPEHERREAVTLVEEELQLAQATGLPRPVGIALRTSGILAPDPADGLACLRESVETLEHSPARLEQARSLVELGSALRRMNRRTDAREPLERGFELANECGAQRLVRRAQHELIASGGRRRAEFARGKTLTASELRVAQLAATGASNAEIAQTLFVSPKTIETHLAHVYAKLGLAGAGSRWRLADALDPSPTAVRQSNADADS